MLIIGDSGSGASTLGLQLLYRQLSAGRSCGLLTYDSFPSEIQKRMRDMGWDVIPHLGDGTLSILDCYSTLTGDEKTGVKDPLDFTEVSIRISDIVERQPKNQSR